MDELLELLTAMRTLFDDLLAVENKKLDAVAANDMDALNECIKQEEAYSLNLRGMDKKREEFQKRLGYEDLTLMETAWKIGGAEGETLLALQKDLSDRANQLKMALEASRKVIETNLESVEAVLETRAAEETGGYKPTGEIEDQPDKPRFIPKEV